jgi:hypothetical protein
MPGEVGKEAAVVDATAEEVMTTGAGGAGTGRVKSRYHRGTCHGDTENPKRAAPFATFFVEI